MPWAELGNLYVASVAAYKVYNVYEDNVPLTAAVSIALAPGEFYHDFQGAALYIRPADDSNPNTNGRIYYGTTKIHLSESAGPDGKPIDTGGEFHHPVLDPSSVPPLRQGIARLFGAVTLQFGNINIKSAALALEIIREFITQNTEVEVYVDGTQVYRGIAKDRSFGESMGLSLSIKDVRSRLEGTLPSTSLQRAEYPYLPTENIDRVKPLLFGKRLKLVPPRIYDNPSNNRAVFLVSETNFDGVNFPLESIDQVYVDGVAVAYTADLVAGTVELSAYSGGTVTVDAKGLKIDVLPLSDTFTGGYSSQVFSVLYFILRHVLKVPSTEIDLDTFEDLKNDVRYELSDYIDQPITFNQYLPYLQRSGIFHLTPGSSGLLRAIPIRKARLSSLVLDNRNMNGVVITDDDRDLAEEIEVQHDRRQTSGVTEGGDRVSTFDLTRYSRKAAKLFVERRVEPLRVLVDPVDLPGYGTYMSGYFARAKRMVTMNVLDPAALELELFDRVRVNYTVTVNGRETIVVDEELMIINLAKNFNTRQTQVTCLTNITTPVGVPLLTQDGRPLLTQVTPDEECILT